MTSVDIASPTVSGNQFPTHRRLYVYVITAGADKVKIGIASNKESRLRGLQTGHYQHLTMPYAIECHEAEALKIERLAHNMLRAKHLHGEWFAVSPDEANRVVIEALEAVRSGKAIEPLPAKKATREGGPKRLIVNHRIRSKLYDLIKESDFPILQHLMQVADESGRVRDKDAKWTVMLSALRRVLPEGDRRGSLKDRISRAMWVRTKYGPFKPPEYVGRKWPAFDDFCIASFTTVTDDETLPTAMVTFGLHEDMRKVLERHEMQSVMDWVASEARAEREDLTRRYIEGFPTEKAREMLEAVA